MTAPDDGQRDDLPPGTPQGSDEPERPVDVPFDEDAAWRAIVENYGERVPWSSAVDPAAPAPPAPDETGTDAPSGGVEPRATPSPFDRSYLDAVAARRASDGPTEADDQTAAEEHFVPPEPPPVPRGTPARRLAWAGLFLPPLLMILAVAFRWALPTVLTMALVAAFVGGFVYLVCTMPRDGGDGRGDGAVI